VPYKDIKAVCADLKKVYGASPMQRVERAIPCPNAQIGSDSEMIASCSAGAVDMVYQTGSTHKNLCV